MSLYSCCVCGNDIVDGQPTYTISLLRERFVSGATTVDVAEVLAAYRVDCAKQCDFGPVMPEFGLPASGHSRKAFDPQDVNVVRPANGRSS